MASILTGGTAVQPAHPLNTRCIEELVLPTTEATKEIALP